METRNLKLELTKQMPAKGGNVVCGLEVQCKICMGRGFSVGIKGAFAHATICTCISNCKKCYGTGKQNKNGFVKSCRDLSPLKVAALFNDAQLPARYAWASFGGFSNFTGSGRQVLKAVQGWTNEYDSEKNRGLLISGAVGIGKTYLLVSMAIELIQRGIAVRFVDFFQLLTELKAGYTDGKADKELIEPLIRTEVLIIDELGKGRNLDWEQTILDQLVNGRYNQGKPIVASTNYKLDGVQESVTQSVFNIDLERQGGQPVGKFDPNHFGALENRVGSRIYSRLWEACDKIDFQGDNYRLRRVQK